MICDPCRRGGALNADANRAYTAEAARVLREAALRAHEDCPGDCGCQHKAVDWAIRRGY